MKTFYYFLIFFGLISCVKKYGCTDNAAKNYDSGAELEDNTCLYDKSLKFQWDTTSTDLWSSNEYDQLNIYLNDDYSGNIPISSFEEFTYSINTVFYDAPQIMNISIWGSESGEEKNSIHTKTYSFSEVTGVSKINI